MEPEVSPAARRLRPSPPYTFHSAGWEGGGNPILPGAHSGGRWQQRRRGVSLAKAWKW